MLMIMMMLMTISTRKMDDDDIDTDNITLGPQYKLLVLNLPVIVTAIKVFAPINRQFQKNPKCFNLTGRKIKY